MDQKFFQQQNSQKNQLSTLVLKEKLEKFLQQQQHQSIQSGQGDISPRKRQIQFSSQQQSQQKGLFQQDQQQQSLFQVSKDNSPQKLRIKQLDQGFQNQAQALNQEKQDVQITFNKLEGYQSDLVCFHLDLSLTKDFNYFYFRQVSEVINLMPFQKNFRWSYGFKIEEQSLVKNQFYLLIQVFQHQIEKASQHQFFNKLESYKLKPIGWTVQILNNEDNNRPFRIEEGRFVLPLYQPEQDPKGFLQSQTIQTSQLLYLQIEVKNSYKIVQDSQPKIQSIHKKLSSQKEKFFSQEEKQKKVFSQLNQSQQSIEREDSLKNSKVQNKVSFYDKNMDQNKSCINKNRSYYLQQNLKKTIEKQNSFTPKQNIQQKSLMLQNENESQSLTARNRTKAEYSKAIDSSINKLQSESPFSQKFLVLKYSNNQNNNFKNENFSLEGREKTQSQHSQGNQFLEFKEIKRQRDLDQTPQTSRSRIQNKIHLNQAELGSKMKKVHIILKTKEDLVEQLKSNENLKLKDKIEHFLQNKKYFSPIKSKFVLDYNESKNLNRLQSILLDKNNQSLQKLNSLPLDQNQEISQNTALQYTPYLEIKILKIEGIQNTNQISINLDVLEEDKTFSLDLDGQYMFQTVQIEDLKQFQEQTIKFKYDFPNYQQNISFKPLNAVFKIFNNKDIINNTSLLGTTEIQLVNKQNIFNQGIFKKNIIPYQQELFSPKNHQIKIKIQIRTINQIENQLNQTKNKNFRFKIKNLSTHSQQPQTNYSILKDFEPEY